MAKKKKTRREHDFLGEMEIPDDVYYGVQTLRALENFKITDIPIAIEPKMIQALGYVKKAAAMANMDLGVLPQEIGQAIVEACDSLIDLKLLDQFQVDAIQGGAGTSTNMNANEVIANKALEILGHEKGQYDVVHPNNHVNCSQSTNDAYPTAFRVALLLIIPELMKAMQSLSQAFRDKAGEFKDILKMGRTQLQDAVPMSLGQEFGAFATTISEDVERLKVVSGLFHEINLGATAIGTGINAPPGYAPVAVDYLRKLTGLPLRTSEDLIEATWDTGAFVQLSGVLRRIAVKLSKVCNDLRLLSSGPRAGINEINLPKMQPGSSIMPGKVNPVIPEVVNQIAFQVIGMDVTVTLAAEAGQLQLNVMEPVIAFDLFVMLETLKRGCRVLESKCIRGITANPERCRELVLNSIGIVTALNPIIGYENSAAIAKEALASGRSVHDLALEKGLIDKDKLEEILSVDNLMNPKFFRK
jgi:aspartate ammonia-lyase